jgi:hypothetical protein
VQLVEAQSQHGVDVLRVVDRRADQPYAAQSIRVEIQDPLAEAFRPY